MAVAIDGEIFQDAYMARLEPNSEIVLIPKIAAVEAKGARWPGCFPGPPH